MTWRRVRLDAVATEVRETVDPAVLGKTEVEHYSIPALDATGLPDVVAADQIMSGKQRLRGGEVLVSRLNPRKARVLTVPTLGGRLAIASGEFIVLRPMRVETRFLTYLLLTESTRQFLDARVQSATRSHQRVRPEHLTKMWIEVPEPTEQRVIADYLDAETARIDALIAKKRSMIELLNERLTEGARHLVSGLGESGPRWDPGPYWLGSVPVAWRPRKIAWCKTTASGTTPESTNSLYYEDEAGIPWVTTAELRENTINGTAKHVTDAALRDHSALKLLPVGAVLIAMYGATVGRLGVLGVQAAANQACCAIFGSGDLDQRFLYWWLWVHRPQLLSMAYGAGQPNISQEVVRGLRVPAPKVDRQARIAEVIDVEAERVGSAISTLAHQIDLLAERRQALITAAVTGELEIPGVAA